MTTVGEQFKANERREGKVSSVVDKVNGSGFWNLLFPEAVKADSISRVKKQTRFMDNMYKWMLKRLGRIIPAGCIYCLFLRQTPGLDRKFL